ncbi:MAG: hypothetical protein V4617_01045 [Gemmatimonadota bacterium]
MTNNGQWWLLGVVLASIACAKERSSTSDTSVGTSAAEMQLQSAMRLSASGAFTPGTPVVITTTVTGIVSSERTRVRVHSEHGPFLPARSSSRVEHQHPLAAGAQVIHRDTIVFAEPGYYAIMGWTTALDSIDPRPAAARNAPLVNTSMSNLWILIEVHGGRADSGYDQRMGADCKRLMKYGSVGAFYVPSPPLC